MLSSRGRKRRAPSHAAGADDGLAVSRRRVAAASVAIAPSARPAMATRRAASAAASAGRAPSAAVTSPRHVSASSTRRTSNASSTGRASSAAASTRRVSSATSTTSRRASSVANASTRLASSSASVSPDAADASLQQQMEVMRQQMRSMHDIVVTLSTNVRPTTDVPAPLAASTDDAPGYVIPPAAEFASTVDTGEQTEQPRPRGMQSLASVPLGALVDSKLKAKIWAGQFVELDSLVGEFTESPILIFDVKNQQSSVQMKENVHKRIFNLSQWTDAFLIFIAIYTESHPTEIASILKYMQLVRSMATSSKSNLVLSYDRDFRKLRAHNNMPWNMIHQELFLSLNSRSHQVAPVAQSFTQRKQSFRGGTCFAFASAGRCRITNCPYNHACPTCGGNRSKFQCSTSKKAPGAITKPANTNNRR